MKILHINCNYITTALHQTMIEHLDAKGVTSEVFAPTYNHKLAIISPHPNVKVAECFRKWDRIFFSYKNSKIEKALESQFDVKEVDLLHAYTLFTDGNVAYRLHKKYGVKYVVSVRSTDLNAFFKYRIHLRKRGIDIMRNAEAIFFLSQAYKDKMLEMYVPKKYREEIERKTYIIPNGIDDFWLKNKQTNSRQSFDVEKKKINIIYAGRITRNKNILTTLKALSVLRTKGYDVKYTIVGKVYDQSVYSKMMKDSYVSYIPQQTKYELIKMYRENDVFVMPSYNETFGLVYAEAMSQGLPVVYTEGQGFDGHFNNGEVGYKVKASDYKQIAKAIIDITEEYSRISQNCIMCVDKFCWDEICETYIQIYNSII